MLKHALKKEGIIHAIVPWLIHQCIQYDYEPVYSCTLDKLQLEERGCLLSHVIADNMALT